MIHATLQKKYILNLRQRSKYGCQDGRALFDYGELNLKEIDDEISKQYFQTEIL